VLHRGQHDPRTEDYIAKRIAGEKRRREATRLLKRYLARHLYRLLQKPGAASGLTGHRSFIPEHWPTSASSPPRTKTHPLSDVHCEHEYSGGFPLQFQIALLRIVFTSPLPGLTSPLPGQV